MNTAAMIEFVTYVDKQITPAVEDVSDLPDASRKHVQRLIYTNLVNRFDVMVDNAILDNCRCDYLVDRATASMNQPITEADLLRLLMLPTMQEAVGDKLKLALRNTVLRERHSRKLATLFCAAEVDGDVTKKPQVNISTGKIMAKIKPQQKTMPYSICGYADWLYSRRNSVVHGDGSGRFLANDRRQMEKLYKVKVAQSSRIQLASTSIAAAFYKDVVNLLMQ